MRIITAIIISALILINSATPALAYPGKVAKPLNKVIYRIGDEQWVKTQTANVVITINATLDKTGLAAIRGQILNNLQRIAKSNWHVTQFNRRQDNSGLERLMVRAETRLKENLLTNLRANAKGVSQAGASYRVTQINFTPSFSEVEATREQLRQQLYLKAKAELARLNEVYPQQHFSLFRLNFIPGARPLASEHARRQMKISMLAAAPAEATLQVSNKVRMTAIAVFASPRKSAKKQNR